MIRCLVISLLLNMVACSTKNESRDATGSPSDSNAINNNTDIETDTAVTTLDDLEHISAGLGRWTDSIQNNPNLLVFELNGSGYEQQTETTWYFDSSISLVGRSQRWSAEGREGNSFHVFDQGKLLAFHDEEGNDVSKNITIYEAERGGMSFQEQDGIRLDTTFRTVSKQQIADAVKDVKDLLRQALQTLRENQDDKAEKGDRISLRLEREENIGAESTTEVVEISIDKKLFVSLIE